MMIVFLILGIFFRDKVFPPFLFLPKTARVPDKFLPVPNTISYPGSHLIESSLTDPIDQTMITTGKTIVLELVVENPL